MSSTAYSHTGQQSRRRAEGHLEHASALCRNGSFAEARELLERILSKESLSSDGWCLFAETQIGERNGEGALRAAREAARLAPSDPRPALLMNSAYTQMHQAEHALRAARDAVRIAPHSAISQACLACTLTRAHQSRAARAASLEEAGASARLAGELAPESPESHMAAGVVAAAAGRRSDAEEAFHRVLEIDPAHEHAGRALAQLNLRRGSLTGPGRLARAVRGLDATLRMNPGSRAIRRDLEGVMLLFLTRLAYLIGLDTLIASQAVSGGSTSLAARIVPVTALVLPAAVAWRFLIVLTPEVRQSLWQMLRARAQLRRACALQLVGLCAMLAAMLLPDTARRPVALVAAIASMLSWLVLLDEGEQLTQAREERVALTDTNLNLLAGGLAVLATLFVLGSVRKGTGASQVIPAAVCITGCAAVIRSRMHRPRSRSGRPDPSRHRPD